MSAILEISTVVGCPMLCNYCPQKEHVENYIGRGRKIMSFRDFKECIDSVPGYVDICFAGMAEPFVNQAAKAMILYASTKHTVSVYTTCYGMTIEDVELICNVNFNHFCIHLPDADGIMKLKVTPEYLEVLREAIKIPRRTFTVIGKLHPEVEKITGPVADGSKSLISRAGNLKDFFTKKLIGKIQCSMAPDKINHNVLVPNGDVLLCCMDYGHKHVIGNLLEHSYDELFETEEYKKVIAGLENDDSDILCRSCEIAERV